MGKQTQLVKLLLRTTPLGNSRAGFKSRRSDAWTRTLNHGPSCLSDRNGILGKQGVRGSSSGPTKGRLEEPDPALTLSALSVEHHGCCTPSYRPEVPTRQRQSPTADPGHRPGPHPILGQGYSTFSKPACQLLHAPSRDELCQDSPTAHGGLLGENLEPHRDTGGGVFPGRRTPAGQAGS